MKKTNMFTEWMKKVNKDNAVFRKANKARKRVILAKDVVLALKAEVFTAGEVGGYFSPSCDDSKAYNSYSNAFDSKDFRDVLLETGVSCDVCAKGALFTCSLMRNDKMTKGEVENMSFRGPALSAALGGIFEADQLDLIEHHYENFNQAYWANNPFREIYYGPRRLTAIMENIIRNKGTFKPELEREQTGRSANDQNY